MLNVEPLPQAGRCLSIKGVCWSTFSLDIILLLYLLPLARLWVLHSIWQLSKLVEPPLLQAVT